MSENSLGKASGSSTDMDKNVVHTGDSLEVLQTLPECSIHTVMTSPPYWNLRDYGEDGQLGLEETPEAFVENLADVFDEVKRVLRSDGSLWLNLGDTYHNKDLQQIPARVALELQECGWILRNRVTWAKPNPMPHSVGDRLTNTTEAVFHFVKNKDYFYDLDAIREPHKSDRTYRGGSIEGSDGPRTRNLDTDGKFGTPAGKNPGDVFEVTTKPFPDAHFAVYPPELCEKPIKATCPPDGVVLDPFAGAGTTLLKTKELGRDYIGIELNPEYADIARSRVGLDVENPSVLRDNENQSGLESYE